MCAVPPDGRSSRQAACVFAWCTTAHGETVHPDDEVHRSAGTGFPARVRDVHGSGAGLSTDVEVGVLRRDDDVQAWVVLEFGGGPAIAIDPEAARTLGRILRDDPDLVATLDVRVESPPGAVGRRDSPARDD